jgi:hypothetical protein
VPVSSAKTEVAPAGTGTVRVAAVVVATLRHWIGHIAGFGRMGDIHRVEVAPAGTVTAGRPRRPVSPGGGLLDPMDVAHAALGLIALSEIASRARSSTTPARRPTR